MSSDIPSAKEDLLNWKPLVVPLLAVAFMAAFIGIGTLVARRQQARESPPAAAEGTSGGAVSPDIGRRLFWTRGRCSTCHRAGERGGNPRGPDLGEGALGAAIGARAEARAREREQQTGRPYTAADYLVESLLAPGAYLVSGYSNEMPPAQQPPVALSPDEIRSIVLYLESLGGRADVASIHLPPAGGEAAGAPSGESGGTKAGVKTGDH